MIRKKPNILKIVGNTGKKATKVYHIVIKANKPITKGGYTNKPIMMKSRKIITAIK